MGGQRTRDSNVMLKFGKRLKGLRKLSGLTQKELANNAGLSISQIARIETGRLNTTISTVFMIAKAMKIDVICFFEDLSDNN